MASPSPADPVAAAQQAIADFQNGHDNYVAQFQPSVEALDPGWKAKAESQYNTELARLQHEADYQQTQAASANKPNTLTTAPTPGSQTDIANQNAAGQLAVANQRIDLAQEQAKSLDAIRQAQLQGKDVTAALAQAKFDFAQKVADQKAQQATDAANAKADASKQIADARVQAAQDAANQREAANQTTNATSLVDNANTNAVSQGNNRATVAGSLLNNGSNIALDIAKGGGTTGQIGDFLKGFAGYAPQFQASMGGAPMTLDSPVTMAQKAKIAALILSGGVPPDANGNLGPNAVKQVLGEAAGGQQSGATGGAPAGSPPVSPTGVDLGTFTSGGIPTGDQSAAATADLSTLPQFTAPDLGKYPTLAAAGSGGM